MTAAKLYAVLFEYQQEQIKAWCWGSCGAGHIGAVDLGSATAITCAEADCPHLEKQLDEPMGELGDTPVFLRKLEALEP